MKKNGSKSRPEHSIQWGVTNARPIRNKTNGSRDRKIPTPRITAKVSNMSGRKESGRTKKGNIDRRWPGGLIKIRKKRKKTRVSVGTTSYQEKGR